MKRDAEGLVLTSDFKLYLTDDKGRKVSPWHEMPLRSAGQLRMVVATPRSTRTPLSVGSKVAHNPLMYRPTGGLVHKLMEGTSLTSGFLPQTVMKRDGGRLGPLSVVDISARLLGAGATPLVVLLGVAEDPRGGQQVIVAQETQSLSDAVWIERQTKWLNDVHLNVDAAEKLVALAHNQWKETLADPLSSWWLPGDNPS
mmetsp:Transcript_11622/g.27713  ORF Transcript_11622/g.27713 Transcript_11622/m.27713 type:complete len:199 (+) Transcript_11622:2-598(+)